MTEVTTNPVSGAKRRPGSTPDARQQLGHEPYAQSCVSDGGRSILALGHIVRHALRPQTFSRSRLEQTVGDDAAPTGLSVAARTPFARERGYPACIAGRVGAREGADW